MLTESVFRTEDVAPTDRFDCWHQQLAEMSAPFDVRTEHAADFRAELRIVTLGEVRFWTMEHPPITLRRPPKLLRPTDPELYHLSLPFGGPARVVRSDGRGDCSPHDVVLHDSARPALLRLSTDDPEQRITGAGVIIPRHVLPLPPGRVGRLTDQRLPGREGWAPCSRSSSPDSPPTPAPTGLQTRPGWAPSHWTWCRHCSPTTSTPRRHCRRRAGAER
ncbi:hypothetical protein ACFQ0M_43960 [Kitasatospora aburaviensis]